jgi:inner membrane protein
LEVAFDLDPYIAVTTAVGVLAAFTARPLWAVSATFTVIAAYLLMQAVLKGQAIAVGNAYAHAQGLEQAAIHAIPQPLSPFHWSLVVADHRRYRVAYLDLLHRGQAVLPRNASLLRRVVAGYRPEQALAWVEHHRFGDTTEVQSLVRQAWEQPRFAPFRRFAELPALYRVDLKDGELCVWFTDLRHVLPHLPPTFRYGLCRAAPGSDWRPYRLRYFSLDDRQPL